jgi:hypothetical protein
VNFKVFGPYPIRREGRLISKSREHLRAFWSEIEAEAKGLPDACGCYVFSIRRRAWYVGLAEKQSFCQECFALHKLTQYNYSLQRVSGEPQLHLLAKLTPTGRFASPGPTGIETSGSLKPYLSVWPSTRTKISRMSGGRNFCGR